MGRPEIFRFLITSGIDRDVNKFREPINPLSEQAISARAKMCKVELSSTLHILCRVADGFYESLQEGFGNFDISWVYPGYRKIRHAPQDAPDGGDGVAEG